MSTACARIALRLVSMFGLLLGAPAVTAQTEMRLIDAQPAATQPASSLVQQAPVEAPIATPPAAVAAAPGGVWLRVNNDQVNLRSDPDMAALAMARVDRNTLLRGVSEANGWYKITPPEGVFCLVGAPYIERTSETEGKVKLAGGSMLRVRAGTRLADTDPMLLPVVSSLPVDGKVRIIGERSNWLEILPPADVHVYIAAEFAERVSDEVAAQMPQRGVVPARDSPPPTEPVDAGPLVQVAPSTAQADAGSLPPLSTTQPASGGATAAAPIDIASLPPGEWTDQYRTLDSAISRELTKPEAQRDYEGLMLRLRPIADQSESPAAAAAAEARFADLRARLEARGAGVATAEAAIATPTSMPTTSESSSVRITSESRTVTRPLPTAPMDGRDVLTVLEFQGVLRPAFAVPAGEVGLRYAVQDSYSAETYCYVEFPFELHPVLRTALGRYVGVRGERMPGMSGSVPLIRATRLTVANPAPALRRPTRP